MLEPVDFLTFSGGIKWNIDMERVVKKEKIGKKRIKSLNAQ